MCFIPAKVRRMGCNRVAKGQGKEKREKEKGNVKREK